MLLDNFRHFYLNNYTISSVDVNWELFLDYLYFDFDFILEKIHLKFLKYYFLFSLVLFYLIFS